MKFTLETLKEIWNNETGDRLEVGPDRDCLGLLEIRTRNTEGKITSRVSFSRDEATLLIQALKSFENI